MNILVIENDFDIDINSNVFELLDVKFGIKRAYEAVEKRDKKFDYVGYKENGHNLMVLLGCMYYTSSSLIPALLKQHEILIYESHILDVKKYASISKLILADQTILKEIYCCHYEKTFKKHIEGFIDKPSLDKAFAKVDFYSVIDENMELKITKIDKC